MQNNKEEQTVIEDCTVELLKIQIQNIRKPFIKKCTRFALNRQNQLTLSTSQTRTVLSYEDVARRGMLGLKRTSVIKDECSSRVAFCFRESVYHKTACIMKQRKCHILCINRINYIKVLDFVFQFSSRSITHVHCKFLEIN